MVEGAWLRKEEVMMLNFDGSYAIRATQDVKKSSDREQVLLRKIENVVKNVVSDKDMKIAAEKLNELFKRQPIMRDKNVRLSYNEDINRVIITVSDGENGRVLREIPSKEIQGLASYFKQILNNRAL